jgi:hypothetical protein
MKAMRGDGSQARRNQTMPLAETPGATKRNARRFGISMMRMWFPHMYIPSVDSTISEMYFSFTSPKKYYWKLQAHHTSV